MEHLLKITFIGLATGVIGTGTGGLIAFFINKVKNRTLGLLLEFSSGLMTAVVCFELFPEAFQLGSASLALTGAVAGIMMMIIIENFIKKLDFFKKKNENTGLLRAGVLVAIGIALHNFPEGFAVGSGFEASVSLGIVLSAVIGIHDIPEGIATAVPLRVGGLSRFKAFSLTVLSGVPMGLGALLGAILGEISGNFTSVCLGFAGGAMLYIVFGELIPESKHLHRGRLPAIGNVLGILCGIVISVYH